VDLGGKASKQAVCKWIFPRLKPELGTRDFEAVATGELTWENEIAWARDDLVKRGLLEKESPRNLWEISDAGRNWLKSHSNPPKLDDPTHITKLG
jgi:restriction system protein